MPRNSHSDSGVRQIAHWVGKTFRGRGTAGALKYYAHGALELLRDLMPERRRSRYGDIDYDFDHGVDTTWARVPLRTRIRELLSGGQYQPSEPELFHRILQALPFAVEGFTFIDLGSGKGRALLMASEYAFARILGVEILSEFNDVAVKNISAYNDARQRCLVLESICADACDFQFPAEPTLLYLFNPFPEFVLRQVLENLKTSLLLCPRELYVVYHNLVEERIFQEQPWLTELLRTPQYAVYKAALGS